MPRPTTRVLAVLEILQSHAQMSGAELARRLDVDGRTLRRYIAMLEEIGIPITAEYGRYGGYRLVPGFKLPPMMFTDAEAQALSLGLIAVRGLGLSDVAPAIESVQAKLDRVLPDALKKANAALRESIAFHAAGPAVGADTRLLRVLSEASEAQQTASLRYRAADGAGSTRDFDVYGLVFRAGRWYVVGHSHLPAGLRTLRLDRVVDAEITRRTFERPKGFDASAYLSQVLAMLPRALVIEVLLRTDLARARQELFEMLGTLEPCEGGVLLRGTADDLEWYARQLIGLSFPFDVRVPAALNATLARLSDDLARRFRQS
jgi:predicted DNA-binding transcriptional regulator YafY